MPTLLKETFNIKSGSCPAGFCFPPERLGAAIQLPYGEVRTWRYRKGDCCKKRYRQNGKSAIGGAVGHNPILIIIPCHRVIAPTET